jgi:hypothetical protein
MSMSRITAKQMEKVMSALDVARRAPQRKTEHRSKQKPNHLQFAAIRLCELVALASCRHQLGVKVDHRNFIFVACHTLAPLKEREGGLDLYHMREFLERCAMIVDEDQVIETMHAVDRFRARYRRARGLKPAVAGRLLALTVAERRYCHRAFRRRITTMRAIDETADRKSVRRDQSRKRKRAARAAAGAVSRERSLSRTKPWMLLGISGRTWERRRKAAATAA